MLFRDEFVILFLNRNDVQADEIQKLLDRVPNMEMLFDPKNDLDELRHQEPIFSLLQLMWNSISYESIDWLDQIGELSYLCHSLDLITHNELMVLFASYYKEGLALDQDIALFFYLIAHENDREEFPSWIEFVKEKYNRYLSIKPSISDCVVVYERYQKKEVDGYWKQVDQNTRVLNMRPEYLKESLEGMEKEVLNETIYWTNSDVQSNIIRHLTEKNQEQLADITALEAMQEQLSESLGGLGDFPVSISVVGDKIANLEPKTLDMKLLEKIPSDLARDWMPKFVYSSPEKQERINIYFPGGKAIGHSAILIKSNSGLFLFDFGLSVVNNSFPKYLPLLEKLDGVFISHAHLDHSGSIPYLLRNDRNLPWFGTKETGLMCEMLWSDTNKLTNAYFHPSILEKNDYLSALANKKNLINAKKNFHRIDIGKSINVLPNIEITPYNAAHLFGSVGFQIQIGNKRILYTGDFNGDQTRTFKGADFPKDNDITLFDGTYYNRDPVETDTKQPDLAKILKETNRILIPAFSMGRSQEMLFQLKALNAEKDWRIYLTGMGGRLAKSLNLSVGHSGGSAGKGVVIKPTIDSDEFVDGTIVIAGQGMLQAGTSRRLFEETLHDDRTGIVFCGYQAPNTLGYHLLENDSFLKAKYQQQIYRLKMSGHTTTETLNKFLDNQSGQKIVVHSPDEARAAKGREDVVIPTSSKVVNI